MNETMHDHADHDDPAARPIPSLVALGRQFDLAAASAIAAERRRTPRSWGLAVAPAFAILVAMMLVSVRLSPAAEASVVHAAARSN